MIQLSEETLEELRQLVKKYKDVSPKRIRHFESYSENEVWKQFIKQVVIAGNSMPGNRLDDIFDRTMTWEIFGSFKDDNELKIHVHKLIRSIGSRYAGKKLETCKQTPAIVHNYHFIKDNFGSPKTYLRHLEKNFSEKARYSKMKKELKYFGLKSCRDFLKDFGLAPNAIAFDSRLMNILQAIEPSIPNTVRSNSCEYGELERILLEEVCKPLGITGSDLDSILFLNYEAIMRDVRNRR